MFRDEVYSARVSVQSTLRSTRWSWPALGFVLESFDRASLALVAIVTVVGTEMDFMWARQA